MNKKLSFVLMASLLIALSGLANAQDQKRQIRPAFPIGAGEKMLVISGGVSDSILTIGSPSSGYGLSLTSAGHRKTIPITLPVGTTLKRVLGDFVDQVAGNITVNLMRVSNADMTTEIVLRSFDTSGISSANATDFKQVVSNLVSHSMLQGWTYYVTVSFPGGTSTGDLIAGVIKVIYEP